MLDAIHFTCITSLKSTLCFSIGLDMILTLDVSIHDLGHHNPIFFPHSYQVWGPTSECWLHVKS
jgi:hypothetical protein